MSRFQFLDYVLDADRREVRHAGRVLHIYPRAFDTLLFFVQNPGRILTKEEMLASIWTDVIVGENNLAQMIRGLREMFQDDVQNPHVIRTIPRRGYVFLPEVLPVFEMPPQEIHCERAAELPAGVRPNLFTRLKSRIGGSTPETRLLWAAGVLGLVVLSAYRWWSADHVVSAVPAAVPIVLAPFDIHGDGEGRLSLQRDLEQVLTTEIVQDPKLRVLHLPAAPAAENLAASARRVGAQHLVEGSVLLQDDTFQIELRLLDVNSGNVESTFQSQGQLRDGVLIALDGLTAQLRHRITGITAVGNPAGSELPTRNIAAYRHYTVALDAAADGGRESLLRARSEFATACNADPQFVLAALHLRQIDQKLAAIGQSPDAAGAALSCPPVDEKTMSIPVRLLAESILNASSPVGSRVASLQVLMREYPDFALEEGAPENLVMTLVEAGDMGSAEDVARRFAGNTALPPYYRANVNDELARLLGLRGDYEGAIQANFAAEKLRPTRDETYLEHRYWLARMMLSAGHRRQAEEVLRTIAGSARQLKSAPLMSDIGWGFYMLNERQESRQLGLEAVKADPRWWNSWNLLGWLDLTDHRPAPAAKEFAQSYGLSMDHDLPSLYFEGVALQQMGHLPEAHAVFQELADVSGKGFWNSDALLHAGDVSRLVALSLADAQLGHSDRAHQEVREALAGARGNGELLYECSQALAVLHDAQTGEVLKQAILAGYRNMQHIRDNPAFTGTVQTSIQLAELRQPN